MAEIEECGTEESSAGGKKNLILFVGALVIAIGASVGGTMFFLGSDDEAEIAESVPVETGKKQAIYHNMRPAYVINYLTGSKPRYLQAEFTIMSRDEASIEAVILHMPLVRSEIVAFLTDRNFLELQTQEGKDEVRKGIVREINQVLTTYDVPAAIEDVLLTNFVLQ